MSHRSRIVAVAGAGALLLGLVAGTAAASPSYATTCPAPTEDSVVVCALDPDARYTYDGGAWLQVVPGARYANGHRPPTGAEVMAIDPDRS